MLSGESSEVSDEAWSRGLLSGSGLEALRVRRGGEPSGKSSVLKGQRRGESVDCGDDGAK